MIERQKMTNVSENVASLTFVDCTMNKQYCISNTEHQHTFNRISALCFRKK